MSHNTRPLNRQDYKTLTLAALGGALEFYDFIIFVFFAAVVGALFFPADIPEWLRQVQTFGIFAAGYLARPLGGIVMAHFGDLIGRKKMFTLSILLMAVPTLAIGLLPTYESMGIIAPLLLLLMRILQGAAIGGAYTPPPPEPEPPTTDERVTKLETENSKLKSQLQMQAQQQEFLENCLLEMGDVVYA